MPTPPASTATVDLTTLGNFGIVDDVVFTTDQTHAAGTGVIGSFLEIQRNGSEQGYNSNHAAQFDEKSGTHALLLASIPIVIGDGTGGTQEGVAYRQIILDANEANSAARFLSLDSLQIWQEESGNLNNFTPGSGFAGTHTNYLAYNLDASSGSNWIALNSDLSSGSGGADMALLIPDTFFINDAAHRFVTLYSSFGGQGDGWRSDSGFEQWAIHGSPTAPVSAIGVQKTASVPGGTADTPGEVISYSIHVSNVGNTNLTGLTVTDPDVNDLAGVMSGGFNVGDTNHDGQLSIGEMWQYTASHTVTQADLDNNGTTGDGTISNTVTADTTQTAPVSATASTEVVATPALEMTKSGVVEDGIADEAGDVINYTINVANIGTTTLTGVVVTDPQFTLSTPILDFDAPVLGPDPITVPILNGEFNAGDTNQNGVEDPGETFQFTFAGDENQNGILDPGESYQFANIGDTNHNGQQDPGENFEFYNAGDTNHNGEVDEGETFQFIVSHELTGVMSGGFNVGDTNMDGALNVGETWQYTVSYTLTQDDIDNGGIVDTGLTHDNTASVTDTQGVEGSADASVSIIQNPHITLVKGATVADGTADAAGDVINYTIDVTNDGNMTLTGLAVSDSPADGFAPVLSGGFNSGDTDHDGKLDLGETWHYTAHHTVTQDQIDNGGVVNPALVYTNTASATTDQGASDPDANDSDTVSVPIHQNPHVTLHKSAAIIGGVADAAGDVIHYRITVTNDGNMTLTGVNVADPSVTDLAAVTSGGFNAGDTDHDGKLDLGETWQYTASHTVTQAEIDNGGVVNPALSHDNTASVTTAQGAADPDANDSDSASVAIAQNPDFTITKAADVASVDAAGDVINYTVTVQNVGNMTLTGVTLSDSLTTLTLASGDANNDGKLDVTETWTYTGSYTVQQSDIDNNGGGDGDIDNTATADTGQTAPESASHAVTVVYNPALSISKAADVSSVDAAGDVINYTVTVDNTGNVTLTGVSLSDSLTTLTLASGDANNDGKLDLTETWTYTGSYTVQQSDFDNNGGGDGDIDNTASVTTAQGAGGSASASVTIEQPPPTSGILIDDNLNLSQLVDPGGDGASVGDLIQFYFQVTNLGNTTLTGVTVSDTLGDAVPGSLQTPIPSTLAGNAGFNDTFNHHITAADISAGHVVDDITVTALDFASVTQTSTWHYDFHFV